IKTLIINALWSIIRSLEAILRWIITDNVRLHNAGVDGSSPSIATTNSESQQVSACWLFCCHSVPLMLHPQLFLSPVCNLYTTEPVNADEVLTDWQHGPAPLFQNTLMLTSRFQP